MKVKINWDNKRAKHAIERMMLRGISAEDVEEAILKGKKIIQKDTKLVETFFKYYSVVYDEHFFRTRQIRKIYPITVKVWER